MQITKDEKKRNPALQFSFDLPVLKNTLLGILSLFERIGAPEALKKAYKLI
jgi:hypothetical protein